MIDTIDTIDTCEFKTASKVVSMVTLGIDTIDTGDRHLSDRVVDPSRSGGPTRKGGGPTLRSARRAGGGSATRIG